MPFVGDRPAGADGHRRRSCHGGIDAGSTSDPDGRAGPGPIDVSGQRSGIRAVSALTTLDVANGQASLLTSPEPNTTYRFRYAGALGVAPAQLDVRVLVRRSVALVGTEPADRVPGQGGAVVKSDGGREPGRRPAFRCRSACIASTPPGGWVYAGSHGRNTDATGRASLRLDAAVGWLVLLAGRGRFDRRVCQQLEPGLPLVGQPLTGRAACRELARRDHGNPLPPSMLKAR